MLSYTITVNAVKTELNDLELLTTCNDDSPDAHSRRSIRRQPGESDTRKRLGSPRHRWALVVRTGLVCYSWGAARTTNCMPSGSPPRVARCLRARVMHHCDSSRES